MTVLQLTGAVSAFAAGVIGPASSYYFKARLASEDIGAAAVLDTLTMTCQIVFGMGIGFCLYGSVPYSGYLLADASGTLLAITCMLFVPKLGCRTDRNAQVGRLPKGLSSRQRAGLYILPALGMVGVPALTLLPNLLLDAGHGSETLLLLLLARSAGQLIGPFMDPIMSFSAGLVAERSGSLFGLAVTSVMGFGLATAVIVLARRRAC